MDIYKEIAANMFNISVDEVTPEQRTEAKRRLCLSMYGVGNAAIPKHIEDELVQQIQTYKKIEVSKPLQTIINKLKSIYSVARIDKVEELELLTNMGVTKHKSTEQYMYKFETTLVNGIYTFTICLIQVPQPTGCIDETLYHATLIGVNYKTGEQFELQIWRDQIKLYGNMASIDVYNVIEQLHCLSLEIESELQKVRYEQKVERNRLQKEKELEELHSREKGSDLLLLYS